MLVCSASVLVNFRRKYIHKLPCKLKATTNAADASTKVNCSIWLNRENSQLIQNYGNAVFQFFLYFMSPKSQNGPTLFLQSCRYLNIPLHIAFDFGNPKITIAFYIVLRLLPVISVPKISVTEYRDFPSKKCNIWFSENRLIVSCKRSKPLANKLLAQKFLQRGITIAHPAHIFMYLPFTFFASHCASLQPSRYRPINREAFDISCRISTLLFYKADFLSSCHVAVLQFRCMKSSPSERIASQAGRRKRSMHTILFPCPENGVHIKGLARLFCFVF